MNSPDYCECVTFFLLSNGRVLAEKRRDDKPLDPGLTAIPGGHQDPGETLDEALTREVREELGLEFGSSRYICSLLHYAKADPKQTGITEVQRIHYYLINDWRGELRSLEAASLEWIAIEDVQQIDVEADRIALGELKRYLQFTADPI